MIFIYYPLILISILGYGFFASNKIIKLENYNLGYQGIVGIFFLLIISYVSTQFLAHTVIFNSLILIIGLILFVTNVKRINLKKKNLKLLSILFIFSLVFILVGKNHDDFHYYHFPYILTLTEYPHPLGLGNLNHGFKTHSSIFLLSSLFSLPGAKYTLFHIAPAYILIFSNYVILKLIFNKKIQKDYIFITFLSLSSFVFINIFFYRLGEHGTDRSAMILIILLVLNLLYFINIKNKKIDSNFLKIFAIIFTIIASLKAFYLIYIIILIPLILHVYSKTNSIKLFFNKNFLCCLLLISFVLLTNIFNTGCFLFPEKKTCFFNLPWALSIDTVEFLSLHYENWAKAGSGTGYSLAQNEKLNYISNFQWINNWVEKYFFNKVSDLIYSLIFIFTIFIATFKKSRLSITFNRNYETLSLLLLIVFLIWFMFHPALRYGGYHLFFFLFFIPTSIFLEKYSKDILNFNKKIIVIVMITAFIFVGRNIDRLIKENEIYSYKIFKSFDYPLKNDSFRYQLRMQKEIRENKAKKIYKNRYIFF
jgi:hypothetical protein